MAARGDGKGGWSITSTAAYQTLFAYATDGGAVRVYSVMPVGEDALVQATYETGLTRVFNVPDGLFFPIPAPPCGGKVTKVEAKGENGIGVPIYGNVIVP